MEAAKEHGDAMDDVDAMDHGDDGQQIPPSEDRVEEGDEEDVGNNVAGRVSESAESSSESGSSSDESSSDKKSSSESDESSSESDESDCEGLDPVSKYRFVNWSRKF